MKFSSHLKAGLAISAIAGAGSYLFFGDTLSAAYAAALTLTGSLFPDLDTNSIPSRWAARIGLLITFICLYTKTYLPAVVAGGLFFAVKSGKHRGFTHSYALPLIAIIVGISSGNFLFCAFGIGLIVHFFLDGLSLLVAENWF